VLSPCIVITVRRRHCVSLSPCIVVAMCRHCDVSSLPHVVVVVLSLHHHRHVLSSLCIIVTMYHHCRVSSSPCVIIILSLCVLVVIPCPCCVVVLGCHHPVSQQGELGRTWDGGYSPLCSRLTTTNNDVANVVIRHLAATSLTAMWHLYSV